MTVTIVDCGVNNLTSVRNALGAIGVDAVVADSPEAVLDADRLILPGVGAAGAALAALRGRHLDEALTEAVRRRGRPMLGICLGMQMLADRLVEFGEHAGLGWISGEVVPLQAVPGFSGRSPHMGWSVVTPSEDAELLFGRVRGERSYYFCHSNTLRTPAKDSVTGTTEHGSELVAAIRTETVFAVQFHPERSHNNGARLLESFLAWAP